MKPERILVVDDETALLRLFEKFLSHYGYQVDSCERATDALLLLEKAPDDYQVVVADLTMPGMSGEEMVDRMMALKPSLHAILCSGYPVSLEQWDRFAGQISFLQKPFQPKALAEEIRRVIGNTGSQAQ